MALYVPLVACGADNDITGPTAPAPAAPANTDTGNTQTNTDTQTDTNTQPGDDLSNTDHLTSGDTAAACVVSACPAVASPSVSCCTSADDVTAVRATEAGKCGIDMTALGFPGCIMLGQPGVLDTACPEVQFGPGPAMPGCCTAAGHCGAMETAVGMGCTSNPDPSTWAPCGSH